MVDLPQHAAQIAIWKHFDNPCYRFADTYRFDWFTPYLAGFVIVRVFAAFFAVTTALAIVIYLVVVSIPLALRFLLRQAGADPWLSLLGFPLAFGFSFYWGFLNFLVAIPIAILYLALLYRFSSEPTILRASILVGFSLVLLASHALLAAYCIAATAVLALFSESLRRGAIALIPALAPTAALAWWSIQVRSTDVISHRPPVWGLGLFRISSLPSMLLSSEGDPYALGFVALAAIAILLMRVRPARDARRWVLAGLAAIVFLLAPSSAFGRSFLFQRSAILLAAGILCVLEESSEAKPIGRGLLVGVVIAWMALLTTRFRQFGLEAADIEPVLARMTPNRRVAFYLATPYSSAVPGAVYLHFPIYYQERGGGVVSWSFASIPPLLVRYQPGAAPPLAGRPLTDPAHIDWRGLAAFDYVVIRSAQNPAPVLAAQAPYDLIPLMHTRTWWLLATGRARSTQVECPPLE